MLGRVRAMRFRGSRSDADIEGANRAFADTLTALARARAAGGPGADIDGCARTVESYRDEYNRYRAGVARIWDLRGTFRAEGNRMSELSNTVRDRAFAAKSRMDESADAALSGRQSTVTALTALAAALALLVAWGLAASLKGPLTRLFDAARRLSSGDDKVRLAADGRKDEIGDLTAAMSKLCVTVGEAFKLRQMVEDMPTAVITADMNNDFRIDYANKATIETLRTLEAHMKVKADEILGQSIDIFHREPGHQRRMLSDPANLPHRAKIRLGGETLDLRVSAMRDRAGSYIGPMLSWTIVTKQVKLADDFEANVKGVVETVAAAAAQLQDTAKALGGSAEETTRQSTAVSAASEQAAVNIQTVASAAEELTSSIGEISRQVSESATIARGAVAQ
ncbi:MAG: HAMP domain-containing protein, partial [Tagaea sp.]